MKRKYVTKKDKEIAKNMRISIAFHYDVPLVVAGEIDETKKEPDGFYNEQDLLFDFLNKKFGEDLVKCEYSNPQSGEIIVSFIHPPDDDIRSNMFFFLGIKDVLEQKKDMMPHFTHHDDSSNLSSSVVTGNDAVDSIKESEAYAETSLTMQSEDSYMSVDSALPELEVEQ